MYTVNSMFFCFFSRSESNRDGYLKDLARDNTQLLLNKIWELPTERVEEVIVAKLPTPTFLLPREKPLPKPKQLTKWQKYAREKGITKIRKSKLNWDETLQVNSGVIIYILNLSFFFAR
jgi:regulator of ribosome biosynthesis